MSRKCFLLASSSKCLATLEIQAQLKLVTKIFFLSGLLVYRWSTNECVYNGYMLQCCEGFWVAWFFFSCFSYVKWKSLFTQVCFDSLGTLVRKRQAFSSWRTSFGSELLPSDGGPAIRYLEVTLFQYWETSLWQNTAVVCVPTKSVGAMELQYLSVSPDWVSRCCPDSVISSYYGWWCGSCWSGMPKSFLLLWQTIHQLQPWHYLGGANRGWSFVLWPVFLQHNVLLCQQPLKWRCSCVM